MSITPLKIAKGNDDHFEDPVNRMLEQTGCTVLHYKVQVKVF